MQAFLDHTKCPASFVERVDFDPGVQAPGFFRLRELPLYGRLSRGSISPRYSDRLAEVDDLVLRSSNGADLPLDPSEIVDNLRLEKYHEAVSSTMSSVAATSV